MAPPSKAMVASPKSPLQSLEFVLFLERVEATVIAASTSGRLGIAVSESGDLDEDIWRAKVAAYEQALRTRLGSWAGLGEASAERFRSRIENLSPTLERSLAARRVPCPKPDAAGAAEPCKVPSPAAALESGGAVPSRSSSTGVAAPLVRAKPDAGSVDTGAFGRASAVGGGPPCSREQLLGGVRRGTSRNAGAGNIRGQVEKELLGYTDGMKEVANTMLSTLKHDNKCLDQLSADMGDSVDKVSQETTKAKKMLRSGQLSFFCTMIMVVVTVFIFFMMIPF
eukprot:CAMPEP_0117559068 /NCGR_PEP_ID=MMETSP0784-20121206/53168_1 /TAXON_ID=39447 /ORGANISM="" /LENGTH=281 /DNA_ID=CAMNT_0005356431 /DNA_START=47 /DNA_END=889 /DNA_ORIENTATION=-